MKKVYVYIHRRNDTGEIFYVGIGIDNRPYKKSGRTNWWKNIVNEHGYSVEILYERNTWDEAAVIEMMLIEKYGRIRIEPNGILVNRTKGGGGTLGRPCSQETKKKIGMANLGNKHTLGKKHTKKTKDKISKSRKKYIGEKHPKAKLTKEDVYFIRENGVKGNNQYDKGNFTMFAETYSWSHTTTITAVNELCSQGLVTDRRVGKERIITITDQGLWVAKRLKEIDDFLKNLPAPQSNIN